MADPAVVIYKRNTQYPMFNGGTNFGTIRIKGAIQDTNDFISIMIDNQSPIVVQLSCDVIVEGRTILVMSPSLTDGTSLTVNYEVVKPGVYDLKWGVKSGGTQKIYNGLKSRSITIYGPLDESKNTKPGEIKSIAIRSDGLTLGSVGIGASQSVIGASVEVIANQPGTDAWLTGNYTFEMSPDN